MKSAKSDDRVGVGTVMHSSVRENKNKNKKRWRVRVRNIVAEKEMLGEIVALSEGVEKLDRVALRVRVIVGLCEGDAVGDGVTDAVGEWLHVGDCERDRVAGSVGVSEGDRDGVEVEVGVSIHKNVCAGAWDFGCNSGFRFKCQMEGFFLANIRRPVWTIFRFLQWKIAVSSANEVVSYRVIPYNVCSG